MTRGMRSTVDLLRSCTRAHGRSPGLAVIPFPQRSLSPSTRSDGVLLNAYVVTALTISEHEHHDRVAHWLAGPDVKIALCRVVEGSLAQ